MTSHECRDVSNYWQFDALFNSLCMLSSKETPTSLMALCDVMGIQCLQWILLTKYQWWGKCFHVMTLQCLTHLPMDINDHLFADYIFRCIFMNEKFRILIKISMKFVPNGGGMSLSGWTADWLVTIHTWHESTISLPSLRSWLPTTVMNYESIMLMMDTLVNWMNSTLTAEIRCCTSHMAYTAPCFADFILRNTKIY